MGRMHARVFASLADRFDLVGAFEPETAAGTRANHMTAFASAAALIEASELVVVAAPTPSHGALVCAALERGRAVLVEKPIASTAIEARRLAAFAVVRGCPLFVGHSERFNPVIAAIRSMSVAQSLSIAIEIERFVPASHGGDNSYANEDDVLLNLGVHDLDLVEHLTGARAVVLGAIGDASSSRLHLTAGHAFATLRCGREGARRRFVRITTNANVFEGDLLSPHLVVIDRTTNATNDVELSTEEALRGQALAIHEALAGRHSPIATGTDGARAVELAELAIALRRATAVTRSATESAQT